MSIGFYHQRLESIESSLEPLLKDPSPDSLRKQEIVSLARAQLRELDCTQRSLECYKKLPKFLRPLKFTQVQERLNSLRNHPLFVREGVTTVLPGAVYLDEHIRYTLKDNELSLSIISLDGVAVGKAFLQLLQKEDITACHTVTVNVSSRVDLQFLTMYLCAPPELMGRRFGANIAPENRRLHINYHTRKAERGMFNVITNSVNDKCSLLQQEIKFFGSTVEFRPPSPRGATSPLNHFRDVNADVGDVNVKNDEKSYLEEYVRKTADILSHELPQYAEKFNQYAEQVIAFISQNIHEEILTPDPAGLTDSSVQRGIDTRSVEFTRKSMKSLLAGKTVHATSDETTHMSVDNGTLFIVDVGAPAAIDVFRTLSENASGVKNIELFITHFHSDHTAMLKGLIGEIDYHEIPFTITIPESALFQSFGYFLSNDDALDRMKGHLRYVKDGEEIHASKSSFEAVPPPPAIEHFIRSRGYVQVTGTHARLYSGDINPGAFNPETKKPYSREEVLVGFHNYMEDLLSRARAKGARKIDAFIDTGHFSLYSDDIKKEFDLLKESYKDCHVTFFGDHQKNIDGYDIALD